jgi:hypothetical protein
MPDLKIKINGAEVVVPETQVTEAVTKGELEIKADTLKVMPVADYETRETNLKNEEYKKGVLSGYEQFSKNVKKVTGATFEGKSIIDPLTGLPDYEASAKFIVDNIKPIFLAEAKIEPVKQITELQHDKEVLQGQVTDWQTKYTGLENTYQQKDQEALKFNSLVSALPNDGLILPKDRVAKNIKFDLEEKGYKVEVENGKTVIKQNGEIVKDSLMNPIALDKFLPDFIKPYISKPSGGAGGGDNNNITPGSLDAFNKEMETSGNKVGSVKYNEEMSKRIKDKTLTI